MAEGGLPLNTQTDPLVLELDRFHNLLKDKDRELGFAQSEIKALKAAHFLKEKSVEELGDKVQKLEEKIRTLENILEQKNLDIKKATTEKKEALAAQFAAEAALRRVHANQKDEDSVPIQSLIAPLEADIRMYRDEIAILQEDKKTLERLTKSKEAALLEAERILRSALERALIVEQVQNQNLDLRRQIEICQEENKILEKTNRQKVLEVEKLSETIKELEEAILAGGAAANAVRDYRRQISELQEEKRTLERELARANVSANRVATTVANEWKDENDKVMPVKQWLEERRFLQAEMQRLRDKLTISERTAQSEAQLKEKVKLRLKTLEDGLKQRSSGSPKLEKSNHFFGILSSTGGRKRSTSQPRASSIMQHNSDIESINSSKKKSLWASRSKVVNIGSKESHADMNLEKLEDNESTVKRGIESISSGSKESHDDDLVSGFLYDRLQKEVISLRKFCEIKDGSLKAKEEENKMLMKKAETLIKAVEAESKKWKRETTIRERDSTIKSNESKPIKKSNSSKRVVKAS